MNYKNPSHSLTIMSEMVMPNDTNPLHNLMGGILLKWMDVAGAVAAFKHAGTICVTASVDNVSFDKPIRLGDIVTIVAKVTRAFNSSMEIFIEVWSENTEHEKHKCNEAYYTFVALDGNGGKRKVDEIFPITDDEKKQFDDALSRREMRLVLSGRMKAHESKSLKKMFSIT